MKVKKYEDKSRITYKSKEEYEPRVVSTKVINGKKHCSDYIKGEDDFCKHYSGSKREKCSCYNCCKIYIPKKKK